MRYSTPRFRGLLFLFLAVILVCSSPVAAQESEPYFPEVSFDLLAFGDIYWVASHHGEENENVAGAWLRRAYVTWDFDFSKRLSARWRYELNQGGDFEEYSFELGVKDFWLAWKLDGGHKLMVGLQPTLTFDVIEAFWGLRYLERTPLDDQGIASRDTGLSIKGPLAKDGELGYRLMYAPPVKVGKDGNDSGKLMAALSWEPDPEWVIDFYFDLEDFSGKSDRATVQGFVGTKNEQRRLSLQYSYHDRHEEGRLRLVSGFAKVKLDEKSSFLGRFDRLFDPSLKGEDIDYLPMNPDASATLWIVGVERKLNRYLRITPNLEMIRYDRIEETGVRPKNDILVRITLDVRI